MHQIFHNGLAMSVERYWLTPDLLFPDLLFH